MLRYTFLIKEHFWGLQTVPETATCSISVPNPASATIWSLFPMVVTIEMRSVFSDWLLCPCRGSSGIQMYLCNREHYGYLPIPLKPHQTLQEDVESLIHVQIEAMSEWPRSLGTALIPWPPWPSQPLLPIPRGGTSRPSVCLGWDVDIHLFTLSETFPNVKYEYAKVFACRKCPVQEG